MAPRGTLLEWGKQLGDSPSRRADHPHGGERDPVLPSRTPVDLSTHKRHDGPDVLGQRHRGHQQQGGGRDRGDGYEASDEAGHRVPHNISKLWRASGPFGARDSPGRVYRCGLHVPTGRAPSLGSLDWGARSTGASLS